MTGVPPAGAHLDRLAAPSPAAVPDDPRAPAVYALVLICLANAFNYLDRSALALVLPKVKADLHLSDALLGIASGLPFSLCYALCAVPAAWVADRWRRKLLLALSFGFWSACTALTGLAQTGLQLCGARLLLGAGEAPGLPASASMISDLFGPRRRPLAFAALASSAYVGLLVGFPVLGWLESRLGWRAVFWGLGMAGGLVALLFLFTAREPARTTAAGSLDNTDGGSFKEGLQTLLSTPSYLWVTLAGVLSAINLGSMFAWGPSFLARVHGLDPLAIGQYFGSLRGVAGLAGATSAGVLINLLIKRNPNWQTWAPALMALLLFPADAAFLLAPGPWAWRAGLFASAFLAAAIVAASYGLYVPLAASRTRALATALYLLAATLIGQTTGPLLVGLLNDGLSGDLGVGAIRWSMLTASSATMLSAVAVMLAGRTWRRDVDQAGGR